MSFGRSDEEARACYARIKALDPTGLQLRLFLAYLSGYFHELRHAHDLSVTTYGLDALFLLLNVYQNLPAILSHLATWQAKHPGDLIPLPIRGDDALLRDLPEDVARVITKYAEVNDRLRTLEDTPSVSSSLSAIHLFEAVATDIQIDFLHDLFGDEAVYEFTRLLLECKKAPLYLKVRNDAQDVFASRGFRGPGLGAIINYLAWCALMGLTPRDGTIAQHIAPALIFEGLVEHVSRQCSRRDMEAVREAVYGYCDRWRLCYPAEMVDLYRQRSINKRLESMAKIPEIPDYEGARRIAGCYRAMAETYDFLHQRIQASPEIFFVGRAYAWNLLAGQLPSVFVRVHQDNQSHDFVTRGREFLNVEQRLLLDGFSTIMRLLLKGRGQTADPTFEDIVFRQLTQTGWNGHQFEFDAWSSFTGVQA
jgi:hypothetical protein